MVYPIRVFSVLKTLRIKNQAQQIKQAFVKATTADFNNYAIFELQNNC